MRNTKINAASFIMTEDCNLACKYCFELDQRCKTAMSKEVAEKGIDYLVGNALYNKENKIDITFFGGEPLLNIPVIRHIIDYGKEKCKEANLEFIAGIVTNATIWNKDVEDILIYANQNITKFFIQMSIDGLPEVQDMYRVTRDGNGSSSMVETWIENIKKLYKDNNFNFGHVGIHGCVNKQSISRMFDSYMYVRNKGFLGAWYMPVHEENWDDDDVKIFETQLKKIAEYIFIECLTTKNIGSFNAYRSLAKCPTKHPDIPCGAGSNYGSITPTGDIYPCHRFYFFDKDTKIGSLFEKQEDDFEKRKMYLEYSIENMIGEEPCGQCKNTGCYNCIATNYEKNGNMLVGFPMLCKLLKVENAIRYDLVKKLTDNNLYKGEEFLKCQDNYIPYVENNASNSEEILNTIKNIVDNINNDIKGQRNYIDNVSAKVDTLYEIVTQLIQYIKGKEEK